MDSTKWKNARVYTAASLNISEFLAASTNTYIWIFTATFFLQFMYLALESLSL